MRPLFYGFGRLRMRIVSILPKRERIPFHKNPRILARNCSEPHLPQDVSAKKKGRRYVQPSPQAETPKKQRDEEKRRSGDRFPVDRKTRHPSRPLGSFAGDVLFPVEVKYASNLLQMQVILIRGLKIFMSSLRGGARTQRPRLSQPSRTMNMKKGPTVATTVGPQAETPKNNAARRSAGSAIVFPSTGELFRPSRPLGSFVGGCCFPLGEVCLKRPVNARNSHLQM